MWLGMELGMKVEEGKGRDRKTRQRKEMSGQMLHSLDGFPSGRTPQMKQKT